MDNTKLLKMIGTTLGTLAGKIDTALAESRPPCGPHITIMTLDEADSAPCMSPCINSECPAWSMDGCTALTVCVDRVRPQEELLQGHTLAQWGEIRKGGYLCEFTDKEEYPANGRVQRLLGVRNDIRAPFQTNSGWRFLHCRPAQIPGVLRPWFGGDCPVADGTMVLVKWDDGDTELAAASQFDWNMTEGNDVNMIAYMEV